jgi:hypothetical protein
MTGLQILIDKAFYLPLAGFFVFTKISLNLLDGIIVIAILR